MLVILFCVNASAQDPATRQAQPGVPAETPTQSRAEAPKPGQGEAPKPGQTAKPQGQRVAEKPGPQEAAGPPAPAGTPRVVGKIAPAFIEAGKNTGQTWAFLRNETPKDMTVTLMADSFVTQPAGEELNARLSFAAGSQASDSPFLEVPLKAGAMLPIKILVTNYFYPGESSVRIRTGDDTHAISVRFYDVPFKVTLQSPTPDKPKLALVRGTKGLLIVKNEDPMRYPVVWRLSLRDHGEVLEGSAVVPGSSQIEVPVTPFDGWFRQWFTGLFKNEQRQGYFTVQLARESAPGDSKPPANAPTTHATSPLPSRTFPVEFDLAYYDTGKILGIVIIVLTLAAGGVLSMVFNLWIPNYLRRSELLGTLAGLANDTRQISKKTDSRLRVGLRVERLRLSDFLRDLVVPSLAASDQLKKREAEAAVLRRRVDMVTLLDAANERLGDLRSATSDAPPSILDSIDASLQEATGLLSKKAPTDDEFTAAKVAIADATKRLAQIGKEDAELAKVLAARVTRLAPLFVENTGVIGSKERCKSMKAGVTTIFKVLDNAQYKEATGISAAEYHTVDLNTQKLDLLRQFIEAANSIEAATADSQGRTILAEIEPVLLEELRKGDWRALSRARCLVRQVKERVTSSTIETALRDNSASIEYEPRAVHANEPIRLRVRLANADWDDSAARHDLICEWDFGSEVGKETGWDIAHYFRVEKEASFHVSFIRPDGKAVGSDGKPLTIPTSITLAKRPEIVSDQAKAEGWRLALAMSFAILALIVGAHEQFLKLDVFFGLVTVLVLGFTTNTIKDLFTKSTP